jgi:hypothetical protein
LLIVGCGSLGSIASRDLAALGRPLNLVDSGTVTPQNPVRQLYPVARIGQPKAAALRDELRTQLGHRAPPIAALAQHAPPGEDGAHWASAAASHTALALLLTGSAADLDLARGLRVAGVPHIVGRCYPRAHYWEAIVVPDQHAPCAGCLRGQLYTGPQPAPTPEQIARYSTSPDLQAEPATIIESGWAASCIATLARQLLAPPGLRERWFLAAIAAGQTCFIGCSVPQSTPGGPAYGLAQPGQVRAYGLAEIIGSAAERICSDCGRAWPTRYRA